jgi:Tfp pilus assembly protein PilO
MSMKRIGGVTAAVAVVLIAVWYVSLFRPQQHQLASAHKRDAAAAQQIAQLNQQVTSLQALERDIPADTARLKTVNAALPQTEDLQDVFNQLHQAATFSGVELTAVSPAAPASLAGTGTSSASPSSASSSSASSTSSGSSTAAAGTQQVGLTLSLTGTYGATMNFMNDLAHMSRIVVVDGASISPTQGGSIGTTLTTRIFYAAGQGS